MQLNKAVGSGAEERHPRARASGFALLCGLLLVVLSGCRGNDNGGTNEGTAGNPSGIGDGGLGLDCVGVELAGARPAPIDVDGGGIADGASSPDATTAEPPCPSCPGALAPAWELDDFQPQSCGFGRAYGLERFRGHTTLVGLFSGWCDFCQAQTVELERMRQELLAEGHDVQFVLINSADALDYQQNLIDRCAFPLFQDTPEMNAFALHGGVKDDLVVYDRRGVLSAYLSGSGEAGPTVLLSEPGYANVKSAILAAE